MPLEHERLFRVRYGECDALGHVNNTSYLRYMQETAFDASAAAGYGFDRYEAMNRMWLARQTEIEYLRPLQYGDSVVVKTWVKNFRRLSSRRDYEFRMAKTGEMVARAYTDWAFMDSKTGKPTVIDPELIKDFFPEGLPETLPARDRFPAAPPPPPGVYVMRRRVAWHDIDTAQYVNNPVFLTYVEDCGTNAIAEHRWPISRMIASGCAIVARRNQIEYLQPAVLDDELEIATWVSEVKRVSALRHYTIKRVSDGVLLARIHTLGVWMNLQTSQPVRIPAELLADFAPNIATG